MTSPVAAETIFSWFFSQISQKHWDANKVITIFSLTSLVFLSLIVNFSLWAPFSSIASQFSLIFSLKFWFYVLLSGSMFSLAICYFPVQYLFNPANESVASVDRPESKTAFIIFGGIFFLSLISLPFIAGVAASWNASLTTILVALIGTIVAAGKVASENDFRLYFTGQEPAPGWKNLLRDSIAFAKQNVQSWGIRGLSCYQYAFPITFVISLFFPILRSNILYLLDPVLIAHLVILYSTFFMLSDLVCFAINRVTMASIEFPLPTPYFFSNTHNQVVNLINGMASTNPCIKLFAFRDFAVKAKSATKASFFVLSVPGNHPRLWSAILTNCLEVIGSLSKKLTTETEISLRKNAANLHYSNILNGDRSTVKATLLKPPTLKAKSLPTKEPLEFVNFSLITSKLKPFLDALYKHFVSSRPLIPTYEVDIVLFAIEGLGSLVECSLTQDKYGIVQKNLPTIVSAFVDLASACDQLIRAKAMRRQTASYAEVSIFKVFDSVKVALTDIYTAFERHIDGLNLSTDKLVLLKEYAA